MNAAKERWLVRSIVAVVCSSAGLLVSTCAYDQVEVAQLECTVVRVGAQSTSGMNIVVLGCSDGSKHTTHVAAPLVGDKHTCSVLRSGRVSC